MKLTTKQFRDRYNIPISTESLMRAKGEVPYTKAKGQIVYDCSVTDALARSGKLGAKALLAIGRIDAAADHPRNHQPHRIGQTDTTDH